MDIYVLMQIEIPCSCPLVESMDDLIHFTLIWCLGTLYDLTCAILISWLGFNFIGSTGVYKCIIWQEGMFLAIYYMSNFILCLTILSSLQAVFKITLEVPSETVALSNMPVTEEKVNGPTKTVYFQESPIMSTYLVAVIVGIFDYVEDFTTDGTVTSSPH